MSSGGGPTVGAQNFNPRTPQEWSALAKRGGDPILQFREGRAILDASPIFVSADGHMQCLDTDEIIVQRQAACVALAASLELALKARGAKWGRGVELSEDRSWIVSAWTLSSTEPNPIDPLESERDAMRRGAIFPRQPDTIPPWQRSAPEIDKPASTDQPPSGEVTDSDADDSS